MIKPTMIRIAKHVLFWLFILFFQITRSRTNLVEFSFSSYLPDLAEHSLMLPILMMASYFTSDYLLPKYYYKKKFFIFSIFMLMSALCLILLMRIELFFYIFPVFFPQYIELVREFWHFNLIQYTFYIYTTVAVVVMIKHMGRLKQVREIQMQLEKQNLTSELALLRTQINPHFLFNTLNNINALVKKDPEKTMQSILKLSDIMRYMLYESAYEKVLLEKEIEYLKSLSGLMMLRVDHPDYIQFTVEGKPENNQIAPMLFVPFVENAFKHGLKDSPAPGITITLKIDKTQLWFEVMNYLKPVSITDIPESKGIGISNLKRRLQLLYPGKHSINSFSGQGKYIASLTLQIEE